MFMFFYSILFAFGFRALIQMFCFEFGIKQTDEKRFRALRQTTQKVFELGVKQTIPNMFEQMPYSRKNKHFFCYSKKKHKIANMFKLAPRQKTTRFELACKATKSKQSLT